MDYNHSGSWGGQIPWPCVLQTYPRARTYIRNVYARTFEYTRGARACTGSPACNALQGHVFKYQGRCAEQRRTIFSFCELFFNWYFFSISFTGFAVNHVKHVSSIEKFRHLWNTTSIYFSFPAIIMLDTCDSYIVLSNVTVAIIYVY